jgi:epoxyqueuosine reductase QueG
MKKEDIKNTKDLKLRAKEFGAALIGIANIKPVKKDFLIEEEVLDNFNFAVSIAVAVSNGVLSEIKDHPTRLYYHHYRQLNMFLDNIATRLSCWIIQEGYMALPIPASQIIDWEKQKAHLSHKKVAILAGLGWIGRSNLLITKQFGSQVRLVTVLTNMPLIVDKQINGGCKKCFTCIQSCPAQAIKKDLKDFNFRSCFEKLQEFRKLRYTDQFICGVCVKSCKGEI